MCTGNGQARARRLLADAFPTVALHLLGGLKRERQPSFTRGQCHRNALARTIRGHRAAPRAAPILIPIAAEDADGDDSDSVEFIDGDDDDGDAEEEEEEVDADEEEEEEEE